MTFSSPTDTTTLRHQRSVRARARIDALIGARDPRLDFFRGIAMFIILMAHTPGNAWTLWIPARFGWSDATEIFVFCSGMASALAFGKVFRDRSVAMGSLRVGFRIWQVYWAHIGLFFAVATTMAMLNASGWFEKNYINSLNLGHFFARPEENLIGLMTLSYVPNYFDILPMYIVALALMPLVVTAAQWNRFAGFGVILALWFAAQLQLLEFSAEPWSAREWFFNPFGWQMIFYTGFGFMAGWIPAPPVNRSLMWLAGIIVVVTGVLSFNWARSYPNPQLVDLTAMQIWLQSLNAETRAIRSALGPLIAKTDFGLLRYVHFLALAYLAWVAVGARGARILPHGTGTPSQIWGLLLTAILKVGQQSLAIFVFSMWYARIQGVILDEIGRNGATWALVNLTGMALLVVVAFGVGWIKSHPWRVKGPAR